jgi:hypothetical protein
MLPNLQMMQDPVTDAWANGSGDWLYGTDYHRTIHFDPWIGLGRMLHQGWNVIAPAFLEDMHDAESLADLINGGNLTGTERAPLCTVVTKWDNEHQVYYSYVVGFGGNFALENGSSYFVFVTQDLNMPLEGAVLSPAINLTLETGYNLVGWPYISYITASELADEITSCVKVSMFNSKYQLWLPEYIVGLPVPWDFDVQMSDGVFVFVESGPVQWEPRIIPLLPLRT